MTVASVGHRGASYGVRLAVGAVALVAIVGVVVLLLIDRALQADLLSDLDLRLEAQARGAASWVTQGKHPERLAGRLGGIVNGHVTIVSSKGRVLGDSEPGVAPDADESGAPEVRTALAGAVGRSSRSETRYVAIPAGEGVVLRIGASLSSIHATVDRVRLRLGVAAGLGMVVAAVLGFLASRVATRPLIAMRDAAERITQGDYAVKLEDGSPGEFGELERSLSTLAARLEEDRLRIDGLERTRRDFVANVSHQLRTPITAIQGYAETLLRGTADAGTTRRFLETVHRQSKRIGELVTELLRLSEVEGRLPGDAPRTAVRLVDVVREAVATARESSKDALAVSVDVPEDVTALADPEGLEQVVENLVENAARHAPGRRVSISATSVPSPSGAPRVSLSVADDGPGIGPEDLPRVFERFYRGASARARQDGGTGLGLAIARHLVESMGGTLSVESASGEGTCFTVELDGRS